MSRILVFVYGVVSYLIFFASFLYLAGFLTNMVVPKTIDSGVVEPFGIANFGTLPTGTVSSKSPAPLRVSFRGGVTFRRI